jgi:hypothetical protein
LRHLGWRDYALLLTLACCWSSTYPLTKIGLGSIPPSPSSRRAR